MSNSINANRPLPALPSMPKQNPPTQTGAHPTTGAIVTQMSPSPMSASISPMPHSATPRPLARGSSKAASNYDALLENKKKRRGSEAKPRARRMAKPETNMPTRWRPRGRSIGKSGKILAGTLGGAKSGVNLLQLDAQDLGGVDLPSLPQTPEQKWSPASSPRGESGSASSSTHSSPRSQMGMDRQRKHDVAENIVTPRSTEDGTKPVEIEIVTFEKVEIHKVVTLSVSMPEEKAAPVLETPETVVLDK